MKVILYLIVALVAPKWLPDANEETELKSGSLSSKARSRTQISRLLPSALCTSLLERSYQEVPVSYPLA